jgi:two-component sensor histidine kinase
MTSFSFSQEEMKLRDQIKSSVDTTLIKAYIDLGNFYYYTTHKGDSLIKYSNKALELSKSINNVEKEMTSFMSLAIGYNANAINNEKIEDYNKAELYLKKGLELAKKVNDKKTQANFYNKFGALYLNQGNKSLAMENRLNAARISESISDFKNTAIAYQRISLIFAHDGQVDKELEYINKAIEIVETNQGIPDIDLHGIYAFTSQQYLELFKQLEKKEYGDLAVKYANKALDIAKNNNYTAKIPSSLSYLSNYYLIKNNLDNALYYAREVLEYNDYLSESVKLNAFFDLANIYKKTNQKKLAYTYIDSINNLKIKEEPYYGFEISKISFDVYKYFKDYDLAFKALDEKNTFDLKLKENDQNKAINELETKYQTELKDAEINNLNQQKKIDDLNIKNKQSQILWLLVLAVGVILSTVLFFRQRALKSKQKILETEQRLNRARINPHFFFNAMASLQSLSQQENSLQTTIYTSRLAKIMRQSLENTYEELVTIENEIDFLKQYLEIQKFRFPNKFAYEFHIDDNLEINELKLPGMLTQPFVENAIEHGFKNIENLGKIDIHFKGQGKEIYIIIEDNGKGFNLDQNVKTHKSRAMQIIKDRLFLFNKQHNSNANYQVLKTKDNKGFKIEIVLPKLY